MKDFIKKYGKYCVFFLILLVISSFVFYKFVIADDDTDANKLAVTNIRITEIKDGSAPFDSDDAAGNDSSDSNGKVRNYDSIDYKVTYDLDKKDGVDQINPSDNRVIIVDVIFPTKLEGNITFGDSGTNLSGIFNNYSYAEFNISSTIGASINTVFSLTGVNTSNGATINPIIVIKESTDTSKKAISELTEEQKAGSYDSVSSLFTKSSCGISNCETTVTGISNPTVKLYAGNISKYNLETTIPIGLAIGLQNRTTSDNQNKGIRGLLAPTSLSFDIEATNNDQSTLSYVDNSARYYKDGLEYVVYIDQGNTQQLPIVDDILNSAYD